MIRPVVAACLLVVGSLGAPLPFMASDAVAQQAPAPVPQPAPPPISRPGGRDCEQPPVTS